MDPQPTQFNQSPGEVQPIKPKSNKKLITIAVIVLFILAIGAGAYRYFTQPEPTACTMEAKQCADGSYVGRTGSNCEFAECPAFDESKFCPDSGNCNDSGIDSRKCVNTGDCIASCNYGCVSQDWLKDKSDCEAKWSNFNCECINNICQRLTFKNKL